MLKNLFGSKTKSEKKEKEREKEREKSNKENRRPSKQNQYKPNDCYHTDVPAKTRRGPKSEPGGFHADNRRPVNRSHELEFQNPPHKRQRTIDFDNERRTIEFDSSRRESSRRSHRNRAMSSYGSDDRDSRSSHACSNSTMEDEEDLDRTIGTRDGRRREEYDLHVAHARAEEYKEKYRREKAFRAAKDLEIRELRAQLEQKDEHMQEMLSKKDRRIWELEARLQQESHQYGNIQQMRFPEYPSMPMMTFNGPMSSNHNYAGPLSGNHNNGFGYAFPFGTGRPSMYEPNHQYASIQRGINESSNTPSSGNHQPTNDLSIMRNMFSGNNNNEGRKDDEEQDEVKVMDFRDQRYCDSTSSIMTGPGDESSFESSALEEETNALRISN